MAPLWSVPERGGERREDRPHHHHLRHGGLAHLWDLAGPNQDLQVSEPEGGARRSRVVCADAACWYICDPGDLSGCEVTPVSPRPPPSPLRLSGSELQTKDDFEAFMLLKPSRFSSSSVSCFFSVQTDHAGRLPHVSGGDGRLHRHAGSGTAVGGLHHRRISGVQT